MRYTFHIVDVFSGSPFGGNQLAVLPEASGISTEGMQKIAREFNFSETTFVLPAERSDHTRRVRIFTPKAELPFAGHPTVGTACALAMRGYLEERDKHKLVFEEGVGPVVVDVEERQGVFFGTLTLSGKIEREAAVPRPEDLAAILSLPPADVKSAFFAGVGLRFLFVHLASREAVDRAAIDKTAWAEHLAKAWSANVFFFSGNFENGGELYARMCAPAFGIEEDPATGSACAALVGAMAAQPEFSGEEYRLAVHQGVAMGRRSDIDACARKSGSAVTSVSVGGATAYVASGEIDVPRSVLLS
jgi:trans-2,3-dihydro-3-hydroxyanthranilate isomerase